MTKFEQVADETMVKNAVGDEFDEMAEPPYAEVSDHPIARAAKDALRKVFDPEIPVDIYELGLIYKVDVSDDKDVAIDMTLTAPGCPVAGDMPGWVQDAVREIPGIRNVTVELVFDPPWDSSRMSDEAKLQLNMF